MCERYHSTKYFLAIYREEKKIAAAAATLAVSERLACCCCHLLDNQSIINSNPKPSIACCAGKLTNHGSLFLLLT
jgi:hypothetical protein